jgi:hypothetical protein
MRCFMMSAVRVLAIATFALILTVFLPVLTSAAVSVTLQPNQGPVGTGVTATGTGWTPGKAILAYFNNNAIDGVLAIPDANGVFTIKFCVPQYSTGPYPVSFTNGSQNFNPPFIITAGTAVNCQSTTCPDAYFIGVHGTLENDKSPAIVETWDKFKALAEKAGKKNVAYYSLTYAAPLDFDFQKTIIFLNARNSGVDELNKYIRGTVLQEMVRKVCKDDPKIVLVGYSLGAWVINYWLSQPENKDLLKYITAVELYGDPAWSHNGYAGLVSRLGISGVSPDPYANNAWGSEVLQDRIQSLNSAPVERMLWPGLGAMTIA